MFISFDDDSIVTAASGLFSFDTLKRGRYSILVSHDDYASHREREVISGTKDLVLTLPKGGAIEG